MPDWNERYRLRQYEDLPPHPLVIEFASKLPSGRALDVACGAGRHALLLAEIGWKVTAVDYSPAAIEILQGRASEEGVEVDAHVADLEKHEFTIGSESFDLVLVSNYLQRDLFPALKAGTRVGGVVIAITPMVDDTPDVRPMNPAFLLNSGELRTLFEGWELIHDFEGKSGDERQRAIAQIVARRPR